MSLGLPARENPLNASRAGVIVIAVVVGLLVAAATYATAEIIATDPIDPRDGGAAEIAFFFSPLIASFCALVTGLTVVLMAGLRLVPLGVGTAAKSMSIAVIGAPIAYVVVLQSMAGTLDSADSGSLLAVVIFLLPAVLGTSVPLVLAWDRVRRARSREGIAKPNARTLTAMRLPTAPPEWLPKPPARPAGFGWRAGALVADLAVVLLAVGAIMSEPMVDWLGRPITEALSIAAALLYFPVAWATFGATVGMKLLGLSVVSDGGGGISVPAALVRFVVFLPSLAAVAIAVGLLAALPVLLDPRHRAIHDRVAGTLVLRRGYQGAPLVPLPF